MQDQEKICKKVVILAGGLGTRLAEETETKPKPMVDVGGRPILWHIMKHYAHYGFREFFIALGYKGDVVRKFFHDDGARGADDKAVLNGEKDFLTVTCDEGLVHLVDTGLRTMTGGRLKRLAPFLGKEPFMLTYGDGVSNVNLNDLLQFHQRHGKTVTVTAVRPPARFGGLVIDGDHVVQFTEKPQIGEGWINGGFFVFEPGIFDFLKDDDTVLEAHALEQLAGVGQMNAWRHEGFWQCMDTLRDKRVLDSLWAGGQAPWKMWP